jgi:hypothetical protein
MIGFQMTFNILKCHIQIMFITENSIFYFDQEFEDLVKIFSATFTSMLYSNKYKFVTPVT